MGMYQQNELPNPFSKPIVQPKPQPVVQDTEDRFDLESMKMMILEAKKEVAKMQSNSAW